jgi:hypothetical protein
VFVRQAARRFLLQFKQQTSVPLIFVSRIYPYRCSATHVKCEVLKAVGYAAQLPALPPSSGSAETGESLKGETCTGQVKGLI